MYNVIGTNQSSEAGRKYLHSLTEKIPNIKVHGYRKWWAERGIYDFQFILPPNLVGMRFFAFYKLSYFFVNSIPINSNTI